MSTSLLYHAFGVRGYRYVKTEYGGGGWGGGGFFLLGAPPGERCKDGGVVRQVKLGFADPRVSYTKAFQRYALELSRHMTIQDVANHLGISWDVIKEIQKADLKRQFDRPKLKHL